MDCSCESDSSGSCKVMKISGRSEKFVKLKVGGSEHQTTIGTLTKHESLLKSMFSGQVDVVMDSDEWVLIDRCGDHFSLILNFLRDSKVALPDKKVEVLEIMAEAEYYGLQALIDLCQTHLEKSQGQKEVEIESYSDTNKKQEYQKTPQKQRSPSRSQLNSPAAKCTPQNRNLVVETASARKNIFSSQAMSDHDVGQEDDVCDKDSENDGSERDAGNVHDDSS